MSLLTATLHVVQLFILTFGIADWQRGNSSGSKKADHCFSIIPFLVILWIHIIIYHALRNAHDIRLDGYNSAEIIIHFFSDLLQIISCDTRETVEVVIISYVCISVKFISYLRKYWHLFILFIFLQGIKVSSVNQCMIYYFIWYRKSRTVLCIVVRCFQLELP